MAIAIAFSINTYDRDGDEVDKGIFIHFGDTMVRVAEDPEDYDSFVANMGRMSKEIHEASS